eukprot:3989448-Lingulodinium_polyedra.AAC.1
MAAGRNASWRARSTWASTGRLHVPSAIRVSGARSHLNPSRRAPRAAHASQAPRYRPPIVT